MSPEEFKTQAEEIERQVKAGEITWHQAEILIQSLNGKAFDAWTAGDFNQQFFKASLNDPFTKKDLKVTVEVQDDAPEYSSSQEDVDDWNDGGSSFYED